MAEITIPGMFLTGNHAGRPSSGVGVGTLYACTTHSLIYQATDTGATWVTWATLGTAGAYVAGGTDVAVADGGTGASSASAARTNLGLVIGTDVQAFDSDIPTVAASQAEMEAGTEAALRSMSPLRVAQAIAALAAGGGGGNLIPTVEETATNATNGTSNAVTIASAASGKRIIVITGSYNRDTNAPTCTNVTFTAIRNVNFGTGAYLRIYVGIATGATGTSVTVTATGSDWIITDVYVLADALTPTAGTAADLTNTNAAAAAGSRIGPITPTRGVLYVAAAAQNDGTTGLRVYSGGPYYGGTTGVNSGLSSIVGYAPGGSLMAKFTGGSTNADVAATIVPIS